MEKIEKIQERAPCFLYIDHNSQAGDLLCISQECAMYVSRLRSLCIKIFKTVERFNPEFMQKYFRTSDLTKKLRSKNL